MAPAPTELARALPGLLAFPLTPFAADGAVQERVLRDHVASLIGEGVSGLFPACGTGELFSLSGAEYEQVVRACVQEADGRVPVVAGLGYGGGVALELAERGVRAGADGFLVLPPYLVVPGQTGLEAHYRQLARRVPRGLILYQRNNAVFAPETLGRLSEEETVIGLKDGIGRMEDLALLRDAVAAPDFLFLNGMPTAEMHAPAFATQGITTYSSAILDFLPEIATRFYAALTEDDRDAVDLVRSEVLVPLGRLRRRAPGYAIAMVKAGARLRGLPVGPVRPPLVDLAPAHEAELAQIVDRWTTGAALPR